MGPRKSSSEPDIVTPKENTNSKSDKLRKIILEKPNGKRNFAQIGQVRKVSRRVSYPIYSKKQKAFRTANVVMNAETSAMEKKQIARSHAIPTNRGTKKRSHKGKEKDNSEPLESKLENDMDMSNAQPSHYQRGQQPAKLASSEIKPSINWQPDTTANQSIVENTCNEMTYHGPYSAPLLDVLRVKRNLFGPSSERKEKIQSFNNKTLTPVLHINANEDKFDLKKTLDNLENQLLVFKNEKEHLLKEKELFKKDQAKKTQGLQSSLNSALLQIEFKKKEVEDSNQNVIELKNELRNMKNEYANLQTRYNAKCTDYETVDVQYQYLKVRYDDLCLTHGTMRLKYDSVQDENAVLKQSSLDLKDRLEKIKRDSEAMQKAHSLVLQSLSDTQASLNLKNEWLKEVEDNYKKSNKNREECQRQVDILYSHLIAINNNCKVMKETDAEMKCLGTFDLIPGSSNSAGKNFSSIEGIVSDTMSCLNEIHHKMKIYECISIEKRLSDMNMKLDDHSKLIECMNNEVNAVNEASTKLKQDQKFLSSSLEQLRVILESNTEHLLSNKPTFRYLGTTLAEIGDGAKENSLNVIKTSPNTADDRIQNITASLQNGEEINLPEEYPKEAMNTVPSSSPSFNIINDFTEPAISPIISMQTEDVIFDEQNCNESGYISNL